MRGKGKPRKVVVKTTTPAAQPENVYPEVETAFGYLKDNTSVHDIVVKVGRHTFLVTGYHKPGSYPANKSLGTLAPSLNFHGEVVVLPMGDRIAFLRRMNKVAAEMAVIRCGTNPAYDPLVFRPPSTPDLRTPCAARPTKIPNLRCSAMLNFLCDGLGHDYIFLYI